MAIIQMNSETEQRKQKQRRPNFPMQPVRPTNRADGKKISGAQKESVEGTKEGSESAEAEEEEKVATKSVVADYNAAEREEEECRGGSMRYHFEEET